MQSSRRAVALIALVAFVTTTSVAQGNSWDKVRYNGGTFQTKVDPKDWDNKLTVTSDLVTFELKDGQKVQFPAKNITALSYGQEAHRRVGTMIALGILITPWALFGLFHKTRLHYIGVEFKTTEGKPSGLLLQGHKDNFRAIMTSLEAASGAPVSVSEKDREFVPGLSNVRTVKATEPAPDVTTAQTGTVTVMSAPEVGDVYVDDVFMGNAPASLKLPAGKHTIRVSLAGYKDWSRELNVTAGSEVKLAATLGK